MLESHDRFVRNRDLVVSEVFGMALARVKQFQMSSWQCLELLILTINSAK
jgi:hypothetical protein